MNYLERLKHEPSKGAKGAFDPFEGSPSGHFPGLRGDLVNGLLRLGSMQPPRLVTPQAWPEIVADAARLAKDGWAAKAIALGWEPLQLFGCSSLVGGCIDHEGLAVRLCGRRVAALVEGRAYIEKAPRSYHVFNARPMNESVFLWDLGKGHGGGR